MAKETVVVEQLKTESKQDFMKFRVFLALGVNRSLDRAYKAYYDTEYAVPSRWQAIADKYHWMDRAVEYDKAHQVTKK
jgi:hypothetical protein